MHKVLLALILIHSLPAEKQLKVAWHSLQQLTENESHYTPREYYQKYDGLMLWIDMLKIRMPKGEADKLVNEWDMQQKEKVLKRTLYLNRALQNNSIVFTPQHYAQTHKNLRYQIAILMHQLPQERSSKIIKEFNGE